jgi:hypothetical protein
LGAAIGELSGGECLRIADWEKLYSNSHIALTGQVGHRGWKVMYAVNRMLSSATACIANAPAGNRIGNTYTAT